MRAFFFSTTLAIASSLFLGANLAKAECYGEAAEAFGCATKGAVGRSAAVEGNLERFGGDSGSAGVLPDTRGSAGNLSTASDIISVDESRRMLRSIVVGSRGANYSRRSLLSAVNASSRPIRRSQDMPAVIGR
ncbi:MAG: hypothetical protein ACK5Y6_09275 [Pseudomonadota bacterium]|jgi:hypothetical protein